MSGTLLLSESIVAAAGIGAGAGATAVSPHAGRFRRGRFHPPIVQDQRFVLQHDSACHTLADVPRPGIVHEPIDEPLRGPQGVRP